MRCKELFAVQCYETLIADIRLAVVKIEDWNEIVKQAKTHQGL